MELPANKSKKSSLITRDDDDYPSCLAIDHSDSLIGENINLRGTVS